MAVIASQPGFHDRSPNRRRGRAWAFAGIPVLLFLVALAVAAEYILHNAEPILRKRITQTLSARFEAPVSLGSLSISLLRGMEVDGGHLRIGDATGSMPSFPDQPMIAVAHFSFRTGLRALVGDTLAHRPLHVAEVQIEGLQLHVPPPHDRGRLQTARHAPALGGTTLIVDRLQCREVKLWIESAKADPGPGGEDGHKPPLEFNIRRLDLRNVGRHQAMLYDADLINAKPVGDIHAAGHFGPWAQDEPGGQPGITPVDGNYTFAHADLASVKGIGGILSSTGHFAGVLDHLVVDGQTDTPDFSLNIAAHPLPLHTDFHAIVDGTTGDTFLQPVRANLAGSVFTTAGKVVKVRGEGHDIQLVVDIPHGRMQDFLRLAVRTSPPLLNGTLSMQAQLHIPPGNVPVPQKMSLAGAFTLAEVRFNNPRWQDRIDGLSARALGLPEEAKVTGTDRQAETHSALAARFTLAGGVMSISDLRYSIPGALVLMNGVYSADGRLFEFRGHVRTQATASAMVGGWKGLLLSPLDHFLEKDGAGVELPVEVSGTDGNLHFGLPFKGADAPPAQLLADVRGKAQAKQELATGRSLYTQADAMDQAAAHAATLAEAERDHQAAVRLRAAAQRETLASQAHAR